jgi:tetratricopeptide (TPR) repeat protein
MYAEAIAELQEAIKLSENRTVMLAVLAHFYSLAGMPKQARSVLEQLNELSNRCYVSPLDMAIVYTGLGKKELALEWFEKAYLQRTGALIYLKVEPLYDSLRSEPRFSDLLRRMNLV